MRQRVRIERPVTDLIRGDQRYTRESYLSHKGKNSFLQ